MMNQFRSEFCKYRQKYKEPFYIDEKHFDINNEELLYYLFPLIERITLELLKLDLQANVEQYEQGTYRTMNSLLNNNVDRFDANTYKILKEIYDENGLRNKLLHGNETDILIEKEDIEKTKDVFLSLYKKYIKTNKLSQRVKYKLNHIT